MIRNTPKNAEPTAKAKLPPFVRGLLCIGTVLLVCFVVSIVLEVWYCKRAPNAAIKLAACLVLDAFAFLLPGVVATITAMHVIRKDKNKFRSAPSSINFSASAKEEIPPAAFTFTFVPTYCLISSTSEKVAPAVENPVEVLMNSAPALVTISHILIFSSSVRRHVSMITFKVFPLHASWIFRISCSMSSYRLSFKNPILIPHQDRLQ